MKNDFPPFQLGNPAYEATRRDLVRKYRTSHYMCGTFTRVFAEMFPQLRRVPGYYYDAPGGPSHGEHWWLVDQAGAIIDPTADQFPFREFGHYVDYDPRLHSLQKGKCPNCGCALHTSDGGAPCSLECDEALCQEYGTVLSGRPYEEEMEFETDMDLVTKYGCKFTKNEIVAALIGRALQEQSACMPQTC